MSRRISWFAMLETSQSFRCTKATQLLTNLLLAQAVAWPKRKRLQCRVVVVGIALVACPALGSKRVRVLEESGGAVHG
jgi:hypothetical protein